MLKYYHSNNCLNIVLSILKNIQKFVKLFITVVLIRDQTRSVTKQVSVVVGWAKIKISLMAQLKGLTAKFKLM